MLSCCSSGEVKVKRTVKEIAREVVVEIAPDEADLFEQMWAEGSQNPEFLTAGPERTDRELGAGLEFSVDSLMSLFLIPLVLGVAKDAASKGVTAIVDYVRKKLGYRESETASSENETPTAPKLSNEDINRIANAIAEKFAAKPERA